MLSQLPNLCLRAVLSHLCVEDVLAVRAACRELCVQTSALRWLRGRAKTRHSFDALVRCADVMRHLHTLDISCCREIRDVSALRGIHTLNMSWCTVIADVSALAGIHTLHMNGCLRVSDVSALAGIHTLAVTQCTCISDLSALVGGLRKLYITSRQRSLLGLDALRKAGCDVRVQ